MPGFDKTGPEGRGPLTGRGLGQCQGARPVGNGRGLGRGNGQGLGRGQGRGQGQGRGWRWPFWNTPTDQGPQA